MAGERRGVRAAWVLAGLLTGLFTVHLAAGYLANLAFAAPFVAAAICLTLGTPRSTVLAAIALGGGGLAHPQFFLIGALVFAGVAAWSLARRERGWRSDAGRVALATLGGGGILAGGLLAMTIGPARLAVDTSKDGFLRRAGMTDAVRHAYLERTLHRWTRYVQWLALPLAALGLMRTSGFARRVLAAWTALVVVGAPDRAAHRLVPRRPADHVRVLDPGARGRRRGRRLALAGAPGVAGHARRRGARRRDGVRRAHLLEPAAAVHLPARGRERDHRRADRGHAARGHAARVHRGRRRRHGVVPGHARGQRDPRLDAPGPGGRRLHLRRHAARTSCAASPPSVGAPSTTRCPGST